LQFVFNKDEKIIYNNHTNVRYKTMVLNYRASNLVHLDWKGTFIILGLGIVFYKL